MAFERVCDEWLVDGILRRPVSPAKGCAVIKGKPERDQSICSEDMVVLTIGRWLRSVTSPEATG
jgi:hypothetical protein